MAGGKRKAGGKPPAAAAARPKKKAAVKKLGALEQVAPLNEYGVSIWQCPPDTVLDAIFERLFAQGDGPRWVRPPLPPPGHGSSASNKGCNAKRAQAAACLTALAAATPGAAQVRVASHVCSAWRSSALEILLGDTAVSRPVR